MAISRHKIDTRNSGKGSFALPGKGEFTGELTGIYLSST
jgi:hypothetical protein